MNGVGWLLIGMFFAMGVAALLWAWMSVVSRSVGARRRHPQPPQPAVWRSPRAPVPSSAPACKRRPQGYTEFGTTVSNECDECDPIFPCWKRRALCIRLHEPRTSTGGST